LEDHASDAAETIDANFQPLLSLHVDWHVAAQVCAKMTLVQYE
jgi:hypothetical protein